MDYTFFHYVVDESSHDDLGRDLTSYMADAGPDWVQVPSSEADTVREILAKYGAEITKEYTRSY